MLHPKPTARRVGHPRPSATAPRRASPDAPSQSNESQARHDAPSLTSSPKLLYTIEAAAELLSLSRVTLYHLIQVGSLRAVSVGRARRVSHQALLDFVEQLEREEGGGPDVP